METRRIKALALVEKLKRHDVEDFARQLGELHAQANALDLQRVNLKEQLESGSCTEDPMLQTYLGNYLRSMHSEIARIDSQKAKLAPQMQSLEDKIAAVFREMKTLETVRDAATMRARDDKDRAEDVESDDIAVMRWWHKQGMS